MESSQLHSLVDNYCKCKYLKPLLLGHNKIDCRYLNAFGYLYYLIGYAWILQTVHVIWNAHGKSLCFLALAKIDSVVFCETSRVFLQSFYSHFKSANCFLGLITPKHWKHSWNTYDVMWRQSWYVTSGVCPYVCLLHFWLKPMMRGIKVCKISIGFTAHYSIVSQSKASFSSHTKMLHQQAISNCW